MTPEDLAEGRKLIDQALEWSRTVPRSSLSPDFTRTLSSIRQDLPKLLLDNPKQQTTKFQIQQSLSRGRIVKKFSTFHEDNRLVIDDLVRRNLCYWDSVSALRLRC